jgi:hypothetical protein
MVASARRSSPSTRCRSVVRSVVRRSARESRALVVARWRSTPAVFNGTSNITVRGTLYLPNGDLTINGGGNANPMCFQLWASTLKINGNASLTTTCTSTQTNSAGSSAGGVRLVA